MLNFILGLIILAAPATTRSTNVEADLRRIIADLREQVASLKLENGLLAKRIQELQGQQAKAQAAPQAKVNSADGLLARAGDVKSGATRDDVLRVLGQPQKDYTDSDGMNIMRWTWYDVDNGVGINATQRPIEPPRLAATVDVYLKDGVVVRVEKQKL